jgi:hypothetical protein
MGFNAEHRHESLLISHDTTDVSQGKCFMLDLDESDFLKYHPRPPFKLFVIIIHSNSKWVLLMQVILMYKKSSQRSKVGGRIFEE